jgi:hypothetical protein
MAKKKDDDGTAGDWAVTRCFGALPAASCIQTVTGYSGWTGWSLRAVTGAGPACRGAREVSRDS